MKIRQAQQSDIPAICSFDHVVQIEEGRRGFIEDSVRSGGTWVAVVDEQPVAYTVLTHEFFSEGFIAMLYVHRAHRRAGIASSLVRHVETLCRTDKLFTSTNESNLQMQALMKKLGYSPSGVIQNLDPKDPELIFFKQLK